MFNCLNFHLAVQAVMNQGPGLFNLMNKTQGVHHNYSEAGT